MKNKRKKKDYYDKKFFVVNCDVYKVDVGFAINASAQEVNRWLKKVSGTQYKNWDEKEVENWEDNGRCRGRMIPFMGGFVVLLKAEKNNFREFIVTLVHEATHVSHYLLRDRRIPLIEESEEAYTYLVEHIVREALKKSY